MSDYSCVAIKFNTGPNGGIKTVADFCYGALVSCYGPPKTHSMAPKRFTDPRLRNPAIKEAKHRHICFSSYTVEKLFYSSWFN